MFKYKLTLVKNKENITDSVVLCIAHDPLGDRRNVVFDVYNDWILYVDPLSLEGMVEAANTFMRTRTEQNTEERDNRENEYSQPEQISDG